MLKSVLEIDGVTIDVTRKRIKNMYLRVYGAEKRVALSCPWHTPPAKVKKFAEERVEWIKKHLNKPAPPVSKPKLRFVTGEKHLLWGEPYRLTVIQSDKPQRIFLRKGNELEMRVKKGKSRRLKADFLKEWYRTELKKKIPVLIDLWEPVMGVSVQEFGVKKMKTRWGTCNIRAGRIWLNLELAKYPPECLEFIVVHEMTHLLERLHSKRFYALMDHFLPDWREREALLNNRLRKNGI